MRGLFQKSRKITVITLAVLRLGALCLVPVSAINVMGTKYSGDIVPGGTGTHPMTVSIGAD